VYDSKKLVNTKNFYSETMDLVTMSSKTGHVFYSMLT